MKLEVKNRRKGTVKGGGTSLETAVIVITDATLDLSQFNDENTPGVRVSISSATDNVTRYRVEVLGRRNIGISEVAAAILAALRGDSSAIHNQLGIPAS